MKTWGRWQDMVATVVGGYAVLSPIWTPHNGAAMSAALVFGLLLLLASGWSLGQPGAVAAEYTHAGLGVLMFVSPWVLGYSGMVGAAWTAWVLGVLAAAVGLWAVPESSRAHQAALGH
jgi:hypothetical protein